MMERVVSERIYRPIAELTVRGIWTGVTLFV